MWNKLAHWLQRRQAARLREAYKRGYCWVVTAYYIDKDHVDDIYMRMDTPSVVEQDIYSDAFNEGARAAWQQLGLHSDLEMI